MVKVHWIAQKTEMWVAKNEIHRMYNHTKSDSWLMNVDNITNWKTNLCLLFVMRKYAKIVQNINRHLCYVKTVKRHLCVLKTPNTSNATNKHQCWRYMCKWSRGMSDPHHSGRRPFYRSGPLSTFYRAAPLSILIEQARSMPSKKTKTFFWGWKKKLWWKKYMCFNRFEGALSHIS